MKPISYLMQISLLSIWILIVGVLFTVIPVKPIAGVIAGLGFIGLPAFILSSELKKNKKYYFHLFTLIAFIAGSAFPIFLLRVFNWGVDFKELSLFGIESSVLHQSSNIMYAGMMLSATYCYLMSKRQK